MTSTNWIYDVQSGTIIHARNCVVVGEPDQEMTDEEFEEFAKEHGTPIENLLTQNDND